MLLAFKIALRFLKSSKGQTILITLGIAIGVSVQIFIGLLIQGLQTSLIDKTIGNSAHITVVSEDSLISDFEQKITVIKNSDNNIKYVSAAADSSALLQIDGKNQAVLLRGLSGDFDSIYNFSSVLYEGNLPTLLNEVIIGKELQQQAKLSVNDEIEILRAGGLSNTVKVVGFYDLKVASLNKSWIIASLATSQQIFGFGNSVTSIEIQISDVFSSDAVTENVVSALNNSSLTVTDWQSQNESLLSGLNGQSISSIMIQVFVIVSVVLGIASVLAISVIQKSKQIGILKAMGINNSVSSLVFLFQGLLLGIIGAIAGIAFGIGLSVMFSTFALNADGTPLIPLNIDYSFIALSSLIAIAAAVFASLIPAIRSSKLDPIEVIKNG